MAERRMFTKKIVDSDAFLEMPCSAQALYFHLCMRADDDGFVNNPRRIKDYCGASLDDLKLLVAKRFVLAFENGIIVIKHWRMHNLLRKDRYTATQYQEELSTLLLKDDGAYTEKALETPLTTKWQPNGNQTATEYSIGEGRVGKGNTTTTTNNNDSFLHIGAKQAFEQMGGQEVTNVREYLSSEGYQFYCLISQMLGELGCKSNADDFIVYNASRGWLGIGGEDILQDEGTLARYVDRWARGEKH